MISADLYAAMKGHAMKTLILNGSPRKNGDTAAMLAVLKAGLAGSCKEVSCYYDDISPCIDCRCCKAERRCPIDDDMQDVYRYIEECDNVVIASPIYFNELTGKLLDTASRLQMYFSARFFRNEDAGIRPKKGGVILVGGGDGDPQKAYSTARILLHHINTTRIFPLVCSHGTNTLPAAEDTGAVEGAKRLAEFLNGD